MAAARTTNALVGALAALSIVVAAWWVWDRLTHVHVVDARIAARFDHSLPVHIQPPLIEFGGTLLQTRARCRL